MGGRRRILKASVTEEGDAFFKEAKVMTVMTRDE